MVPIDARSQQALYIDIIVISADDQDFHFWITLTNLVDGQNRLEFRHSNIDQQTIDALPLESRKGLWSVSHFIDHFQTRDFFNRVANAGPHDGMIVGQQYPNITHTMIYTIQDEAFQSRIPYSNAAEQSLFITCSFGRLPLCVIPAV